MWEWPADKVVDWLTMIFAGAAAYVPWRQHRRAVREAAEAEAKAWSAIVDSKKSSPPFWYTTLRLDGVDENRLYLESLTIKRPAGAKITKTVRIDDDMGNHRYGPDTEACAKTLLPKRDLDPTLRIGGGSIRTLDHANVSFYICMPSRPWFARSDRTRAEIEASVEERSASRKVSRVRIRTQPIEWAASSAQSTT